MSLDWRGHGSLKPCVKHPNVLRKNSDMAHRRPGFVEITETRVSEFKPWNVAEACRCMRTMIDAQDRVADGRMTNVAYKDLLFISGLNPNRNGLLADAQLATRLNVLKAVTYDWVHNTFQDGTFTTEATVLLERASEVGVTYQMLEEFLASNAWCFPSANKSKAKELHRVFSSWRNPNEEETKVRGSASELLGLYGMLRHFVETRK